jgi:hypothetical protein
MRIIYQPEHDEEFGSHGALRQRVYVSIEVTVCKDHGTGS